MTSDTELQPAVAAEFLALADLLAGASDAQWDTQSLCEGWRVREVIAHMTMAARYSEEAFVGELERCAFDFTRLSNEVAGRDAKLPTGELVANLRSDVMHQWVPPGGGYHGALNHVVIHGLDVTVPLGVPRRCHDETMRVVLEDLTRGGSHAHFGVDLDGPPSGDRSRLVVRLGTEAARPGRRPLARTLRSVTLIWSAPRKSASRQLTRPKYQSRGPAANGRSSSQPQPNDRTTRRSSCRRTASSVGRTRGRSCTTRGRRPPSRARHILQFACPHVVAGASPA